MDEVETPLFIQMNDRFGVGSGTVPMAESDQSLAKDAVVVDLPVERDPDLVVLVAHGIAPGG